MAPAGALRAHYGIADYSPKRLDKGNAISNANPSFEEGAADGLG
jgi:hypothetical protein